ncbi:hypothetical protein [Sinorhizobium fredii]|uniref:Uncharacterized protein n=1 Tax=Sinorhizobium fredii (strain HH103) TaxID=1117943 RepID=A0A0A8WJG8_SINF1|nr:hypothetical protein [Sinorhizobium fredii]CEL26586.1 hypothetical protein [Sinorhizobium fredii HH103]
MKGTIKAYWDARKPIEDEYRQRKAVDDAAFQQKTQKVERLSQEIQTVSGSISQATMEFIRFFIENKRELPPELQEYVQQWQKENIGSFTRVAKLRDELVESLKDQHDASSQATRLYEETMSKLWLMTQNFEAKIVAVEGKPTSSFPPLPL